MALRAAFAVTSLLAVASPAVSEPVGSILAEMEADRIPSVAAAIVTRDGIVWSGVYGLRDVEAATPAREDTIYLLSSISKLFVAVAVMQQVERGAVDLDADVGDYLSFPVRSPHHPDAVITVRHLMTHSSGLANPGAEVPSVYSAVYPEHPFPLGPWLSGLLAPGGPDHEPGAWTAHAPGEAIESSNVGVTLLAHLVEAVTGENFAEHCARHIFGPLAMHDTGYRLADVDASRLATQYTASLEPLPLFGLKIYPAGMLRSTTADLARFLRAMLEGGALDGARILEEATIHRMLHVTNPGANLAFGAGLALLWRSYGDGPWLGHTGGGSAGVTASVDLDPVRGVGVILLCNAARRYAVTPGGTIWERLHQAAAALGK